MKLDKVEIVNYRSIKKETISFDQNCRVLVGINESGKSNILKALSFLSTTHKPVCKDDVRESLPEEGEVTEAYVKFFFRFEKAEADQMFVDSMSKILSSVKDPEIVTIDGITKRLKSFCNLRSDVRFKVNLINETKEHRYTTFAANIALNGSWKKPSKACPVDFEVEYNGKKVKISNYSLVDVSDLTVIPAEYLEDAKLDDLATLLGGISNQVSEANILDSLFWEYDESNLLPSQISIEEFANNPDICLPLKNMFILNGVSDIRTEITRVKALSHNQVQNFLDRVASKTTTHFRSVWKEYKTIEFQLRVDADKIIPAIKEKNSFDFSKRSDGFKRFVTFLLMISVKVKTDSLKNTLLLIDEPDSSLHPSGARYLRDELIRISAKNYVLYSTHSIFMIDAGNIGRHYMVKKNDEITTVETAKDSNIVDEEVLFNALGYSVFETLNAKNIIFEGWKDKKLFITALDKSSAELKGKFKDVGLCHAKGVKHIKTITPIMELAQRSCIIVSDSDTPAKEQQKQYKKEKGFGEWNIYQDLDQGIEAITGEDFIKKSTIVKQVNQVIAGFGLPVFTEAELTDKEKLKAIETWLKANSLTPEQVKDTIEKIKDLIFDNLTNKDIDTSYAIVISSLASLVSPTP